MHGPCSKEHVQSSKQSIIMYMHVAKINNNGVHRTVNVGLDKNYNNNKTSVN